MAHVAVGHFLFVTFAVGHSYAYNDQIPLFQFQNDNSAINGMHRADNVAASAGAVDKSNLQLMYHLHEKMYQQGVHGIISALAVKVAKQVSAISRKQMSTCLHKAGTEVALRAKCVAAALDHRADELKPEFRLLNKKIDGQKAYFGSGTAPRRALAQLAVEIESLQDSEAKSHSSSDQTTSVGENDENETSGGESSLWGTVAGVLTDVVRFLKGENPTGAEKYDASYAELNQLYKLQGIMKETEIHHDDPQEMVGAPARNSKNMGYQNLDKNQRYLLSMLGTFSKVAHSQNYSSLSLFSPKLLSLSPEDPKVRSILSPRFLSLYKEEPGSLHTVLDTLGTEPDTRDAWLALVVEATNTDETVQKIFGMLENPNQNDPDSQGAQISQEELAKAHLHLSKVWDDYEKSFDHRQRRSIDENGYAFLDKRQYDILYGAGGPYSQYGQFANVQEFSNLSEDEKQFVLEQRIRQIAQNHTSGTHFDEHKDLQKALRFSQHR